LATIIYYIQNADSGKIAVQGTCRVHKVRPLFSVHRRANHLVPAERHGKLPVWNIRRRRLQNPLSRVFP
jgi:hypothetical protein